MSYFDAGIEEITKIFNALLEYESLGGLTAAYLYAYSIYDGTVIAEKTAAETLVSVVKKIGVAEVRKVVEDYNLKFCRVPVISNRRDSKYGSSQKDLGGGWLLITHSNNPMKKAFIEKVSDILHLGLNVTLKV